MNRFTRLTGLLVIVGVAVTSCYCNEPPNEALSLEMERGRAIAERMEGLLAASQGFMDVYPNSEDTEITPQREAAFEELKLYVPGLRVYSSLREIADVHGGEYEREIREMIAVMVVSVMVAAQLYELKEQLTEHSARFEELKCQG